MRSFWSGKRVTVTGGAGWAVVRVIDRGRGFDPGATPPSHRGIRESITGRMLAAGGRAAIASRPGADGDEVVWAQELLNAAGARLPVGGFYGARTARALAGFQARRGLHANGILDPATWMALLREHAREPSWANGPPDSARE